MARNATPTPVLMLFQIAEVQSESVSTSPYQLNVKPCGGKEMNSVSVKDTGITTMSGTSRMSSTRAKSIQRSTVIGERPSGSTWETPFWLPRVRPISPAAPDTRTAMVNPMTVTTSSTMPMAEAAPSRTG